MCDKNIRPSEQARPDEAPSDKADTESNTATSQAGDSHSTTATVASRVWLLPTRLLIGMVRIYQMTLSPLIGQECRFQPTCSHYFIGAVRKYGAMRGSWRGLKRIARCQPWGGSGYDPP